MTKTYVSSNDRLAKILSKTVQVNYYTIQVFLKSTLRSKTTGEIIITRGANKPVWGDPEKREEAFDGL